jgi:hypothetical protein
LTVDHGEGSVIYGRGAIANAGLKGNSKAWFNYSDITALVLLRRNMRLQKFYLGALLKLISEKATGEPAVPKSAPNVTRSYKADDHL